MLVVGWVDDIYLKSALGDYAAIKATFKKNGETVFTGWLDVPESHSTRYKYTETNLSIKDPIFVLKNFQIQEPFNESPPPDSPTANLSQAQINRLWKEWRIRRDEKNVYVFPYDSRRVVYDKNNPTRSLIHLLINRLPPAERKKIVLNEDNANILYKAAYRIADATTNLWLA